MGQKFTLFDSRYIEENSLNLNIYKNILSVRMELQWWIEQIRPLFLEELAAGNYPREKGLSDT